MTDDGRWVTNDGRLSTGDGKRMTDCRKLKTKVGPLFLANGAAPGDDARRQFFHHREKKGTRRNTKF